MKKLVFFLCAAACGLAAAARAASPLVNLNEADFSDRVYACWQGKNIGGTLGMPFEGDPEPRELTFYTDLKKLKEGPAPNDDLDLQLLWLKAMEEHGGRVDARLLGQYWLKFVPVNWNEYGECKRNMRLGLLPPLSGEFNNARWKHSNGAWIRSEIWACLAPGCPALAARMAREDACVDHGAGEGTLAALFTAAVESAAFIEKDRDRLIRIGLAMIPPECGVARAVGAAVAAHRVGKDWRAARLDVIRASEDTGWFQAPRNVAYTMIGWLYGEGDFGKSLCIAVGCGDDTDCTGATLGAIFGILHGTRGIPARWSRPIGTKIRTVAVAGFPVPGDLGELTDRTVAMTRKVLALNACPVALTPAPADLRRAGELKLADPEAVRPLWTRSPYRIVWGEPGRLRVTLDYVADPVIEAGRPHALALRVENLGGRPADVGVVLKGLPAGWRATGLPERPAGLVAGAARDFALILTADAVRRHAFRMSVEVTGLGTPLILPLGMFNKDILQKAGKSS